MPEKCHQKSKVVELGGGFKYLFVFNPGGFMIQFDLRIFFKWVVKKHQLVRCVFLVLRGSSQVGYVVSKPW